MATNDLQVARGRTLRTKTEMVNQAVSLYEFVDAELSLGEDRPRTLGDARQEREIRGTRPCRVPRTHLLHASSAKTALWRRVLPVPPDRCADRLLSWPSRGDMDILRGLLYIPIEPWLKESPG
jgi:hypothetical protein